MAPQTSWFMTLLLMAMALVAARASLMDPDGSYDAGFVSTQPFPWPPTPSPTTKTPASTRPSTPSTPLFPPMTPTPTTSTPAPTPAETGAMPPSPTQTSPVQWTDQPTPEPTTAPEPVDGAGSSSAAEPPAGSDASEPPAPAPEDGASHEGENSSAGDPTDLPTDTPTAPGNETDLVGGEANLNVTAPVLPCGDANSTTCSTGVTPVPGNATAAGNTSAPVLAGKAVTSVPPATSKAPAVTPKAAPPPYRSSYCRCKDNECQNDIPGDYGAVCEAAKADGSCRSGYKKCVSTSSYKIQMYPKTPKSVTDMSFSLLASDIIGTLYNLGDQNPISSNKKWWVALRLPTDWRFVTWDMTTLQVQLVAGDSNEITTRQFQVRPCKEVTDEKNCRDENVGFVDISDMLSDWETLMTSTSKSPITFQLLKSIVSGGQSSSAVAEVGVFLVFEKATTARRLDMRELYVAATGSADAADINLGDLSVITLATMEVPSISTGRLYSSLLWVEIDKKKATLSFSTSTIIGNNSLDPKVCINLRSSTCAHRGQTPTSNVTFESGSIAAYVAGGNPFIDMYSLPGDSPLKVTPVNETYFCVESLKPTGLNPNQSWEVNREFAFQLYVQGAMWSSTLEQNKTGNNFRVPFLAEISLIDRDVVQGSDCSQLIVHDQTYTNHELSVYSVMSVTIYAVGLVGAILITRMNGISFSAATFYNDMTSVGVIMTFTLSIIGNAFWINVSSDTLATNASHVYYLLRILAICFSWTMMTSVCFHWSTVLSNDVRKIKRFYLMLAYSIVNGGFFAFGLFTLICLSDFFKCTYDDYLKNPKYDKRICETDYCPDLQPFQWKYATEDLCRGVPYAEWYVPTSFGAEILMFVAAVALLVLGTSVLRRGSRLIEHSGDMIDEASIAAMRKSLTTYLVVILAITVSLGIPVIVNIVLYTLDWKLNAILWYTFTIWLPTIIPPAGFLILQWNPRVNGGSWSRGNQDVKNRKTIAEDKYGARENSTFGLLSDGWAGITDFPDTDYLPIGAETKEGNQNVMALSVQLVTPVSLGHACYMELYIAETEGNDVTGDDFEGHVRSRRASISALIQSGIQRESMIHRRSGLATFAHPMSASNPSWVRVGLTETVVPTLIHSQGDTSKQMATFMSILQIPEMNSNPMVRFVVYEIPDSVANSPASQKSPEIDGYTSNPVEGRPNARVSGLGLSPPSKPRVFCEFTCSSAELSSKEDIRLVAPQGSHRASLPFNPASSHGSPLGPPDSKSAPVLRVRSTTVTTRTLKENNGFYITKCFQFSEGDEMVVEDMTESIFTNEIPRQYLDLLLKERGQDLSRAERDLREFEEKCKLGLGAGMYDNLIDQIQGENVQAVAQAWLEERIRQRSMYMDALKECQQLCVDRAEEGLNFKASTEKKSSQLRFLPINLHVQDMWVGPTSDLRSQFSRRTSEAVKLYSTVTVGAFAAHSFKFRHGAGILTLRSRLAKKPSNDRLLTRNNSGVSDTGDADLDWTQAEVRAEDELKWQLATRTDMCVSQALTGLVASFCRNLEAALQHPNDRHFLKVINSIGFLWQIESLLSTQGKEIGMLEDYYAAVQAMGGVRFMLDTSPPKHLPSTLNLHMKDADLPSVVSARVSGDARHGNLTVVIGVRCSSDVLKVIPQNIREGGKISVTPVFFTQGINEMQTLANSSSAKKTTLQDNINRDSYEVLCEYVEKYKKLASEDPSAVPTDVTTIANLVADLEERIMLASKQMVKTKHPKIIQQSSRLCRLLGAGRVTSCKSAKDRTGMSVTLEQGHLLADYHGLPAEFLTRTISTMRSNGVRLENAFKNTGKRQFAFNSLQRSLLPDEYKCPEGTYGRGNVS
ncbi:hypothetical protein Poli38472_008532 [Pythium oligandrum]|uniref:Inositol-3,4-bisphosphate 4-phosphatase n=1 Tax=Pythium oligandrum TaxID=41045 RepID=A0A8K1C3M2_PYTOL|nr:hypothetical protein Poli38472_008532 [Pythium oligandrum]|eukprot:TMW55884.1 hypothetical protein Poli38472_008532 [Pythium oligandrum]